MEKSSDNKGEALSRDEMKKTKGGAGAPSLAVAASAVTPPSAAQIEKELKALEPKELAMETLTPTK